MLKLQKINNSSFEEESALINVDTKELITKGDCYHDKIDEYIDGILYGLLYGNIDYEELEPISVTPDMELFKLCEFYNDCSYNNQDDNSEDEFEEDNDTDYVDTSNNFIEETNVEEIKEEIILPHQVKHQFEIYGDSTIHRYCNIIDALEITKNYETDLFCTDTDFHDGIVYSCLGLDDEDNNDLLKPFGVYYDENNKLQIIR